MDLSTWSVTRLASVADGTTEGGRIRAIASLGLGASLITVGGSLVRLDYTTGASQSQHPPQAVTLLDGFETPWGIALDPLQTNRIYLAERDYPRADGGTGRVTTLELDTYIQSPVFVREDTLPGAGLERPTSIALERRGARLLVVTDDGQELRGIEIGGRDPGVVFELPTGPGPKVSLATGSDGMRILALTETNELAVAGGMLQRRSVVSYDPRSLTARVSVPFDPAPGPNSRWRIAEELGAAQSSPEGRANLFVWNGRDVPEGDVHLRIVPLDTDRGVENEAILPKRVRSFRDPKILGGLGTLDPGRGLEAVDVDHDGRLDAVASSHGFRGVAPGLAVFLQRANGSFPVAPDMTLGSFGLSVGMLNLAAADLNADGRTDLVGLRTNFLDALICPNAPPEVISRCHPLTEDSLVLFHQPRGGFLPGQVAACEIRQDSADLTETQFLRIADLNRDRRPIWLPPLAATMPLPLAPFSRSSRGRRDSPTRPTWSSAWLRRW